MLASLLICEWEHVCERVRESVRWQVNGRHVSVDDNADGDGIKRVKIAAMCVRKRAKVLKWSTCVLVIAMSMCVYFHVGVCVCFFCEWAAIFVGARV